MNRTIYDKHNSFQQRQEEIKRNMAIGKTIFDIVKEEEEANKTKEHTTTIEPQEEYDEFSVSPQNVKRFFKGIADDNKLSVNMLSKVFDISCTSVQNWVNSDDDRFVPTLKILSKVAICLDIPLWECVRLMQTGEKPPLIKVKRPKEKEQDKFDVSDIQKLTENLLNLSNDERSLALESILTAFYQAGKNQQL